MSRPRLRRFSKPKASPCTSRRNASASSPGALKSPSGLSARLARRRSPVPTCCSRSGAGPTPMTWGLTWPGLKSTRAATSSSMTNSAPARPVSGRLATAMAAAPSPTPSYNDFEIVAANLLDGERRRVSDRILGYALYIDPPLGRVGMTEAQARASGRPLLVGRRPMTRVGRAIEKGETLGFMMAIADAETQQILGAAILGTGGDEAIHGILDAMNARIPYTRLKWAVPIHPTVSELIPTLLGEMKPVQPQSP